MQYINSHNPFHLILKKSLALTHINSLLAIDVQIFTILDNIQKCNNNLFSKSLKLFVILLLFKKY